jgi:hypothetical protein
VYWFCINFGILALSRGWGGYVCGISGYLSLFVF